MDGDVSQLTADHASTTFLIGIAGCSSSGKTTLANTLAEVFAPFVNEQAETESTASSSSPDRVAVIHQDDYFLPKDQCPRASFRPRLPSDENVVAGEIQSDGRVVTADTDCLEAVDWVRLRSDVEGILKRKTIFRPAERQEVRGRLLEGEDGVAERCKIHRDAIRACATVQALKNAEGGLRGKYFRTDDEGRPMLGCRLGIVEGFLLFAGHAERRPREQRVEGGREAIGVGQSERPYSSPSDDSQGREDGAHQDVTGTGEQPCETNSGVSDQRAAGLWKKTLRCIKSPLQAPKDPKRKNQQQHPGENAPENRDLTGNDDTPGQPKTDSWTLRNLVRRVQKGAFFARDSNQGQQEDSSKSESKSESESDEGSLWGTDVGEQFITSKPGGRDHPAEREPEKEESGEDVGSGEEQPAAEPGRDDPAYPVRPGSVRQGDRVFCDKSTCRFCKGKGVEGRDEQSPCRAPGAPDDDDAPFRGYDGDVVPGGSQGGGGEEDRPVGPETDDGSQPDEGQHQHAAIRGLPGHGEQPKPSGPDQRQPAPMPWGAVLRRMDARLFLAARKETVATRRFSRDAYVDGPRGLRRPGQTWRARGYFEDVAWHKYGRYHGHLGGGRSPGRHAGLRDGLLLEGEGGVHRVQSLTTDGAEVEAVVAWAVGAVLERMVELEEEYRNGGGDGIDE